MELPRKDWEIYALMRTLDPSAARRFMQARKAAGAHRIIDLDGPAWRLVHVSDDGDYMVSKLFIPRHLSRFDWEDLADQFWIEAPNGPFDCTGQVFSERLKRFKVPGGTWVYHWTARDV